VFASMRADSKRARHAICRGVTRVRRATGAHAEVLPRAHRFCPGSLSEEQAVRAAIATWPPGVRPVVHWSESQEGRKAHAHSDYVNVRPDAALWWICHAEALRASLNCASLSLHW